MMSNSEGPVCPIMKHDCCFDECILWSRYQEDCQVNEISYNLAKIASSLHVLAVVAATMAARDNT